jgi:hypothetical protein
MPIIAFTTFAILKAPYGDLTVKGFEDLTPLVFAEAEASPGFIGRAKETDDKTHLSNFERDWGKWGKFAVPRFYDGGHVIATDTRASTLSLWSDVDAVHLFVYRNLHRNALTKREEWFRKPSWPTYAMWWVSECTIPTWAEAAARLEHVYDNGPSPIAFDFRRRFSASECPIDLALCDPAKA